MRDGHQRPDPAESTGIDRTGQDLPGRHVANQSELFEFGRPPMDRRLERQHRGSFRFDPAGDQPCSGSHDGRGVGDQWLRQFGYQLDDCPGDRIVGLRKGHPDLRSRPGGAGFPSSPEPIWLRQPGHYPDGPPALGCPNHTVEYLRSAGGRSGYPLSDQPVRM